MVDEVVSLDSNPGGKDGPVLADRGDRRAQSPARLAARARQILDAATEPPARATAAINVLDDNGISVDFHYRA